MRVDQVIKYYGSQVAVAEALNVRQPTVSMWRKRGRVPQLQQLRIERATRGKLKADAGIL